MGKQWNSDRLYFLGLQNHCIWWLQSWHSKTLAPWKKAMTNLDNVFKSRDTILQTKVCIVKAMVFPVVMYGCDSWTIKKVELWRTDAFELYLEKILETPLDSKEIKPVKPKRNQSWIFIERTDTEAEAEAPVLWPSDAKYWVTGKDPDAGKYWRQKEKGMTEGEMVGWHHQINRHDYEQAPGHDDVLRNLACCNPWVAKSQMWFNKWTELVSVSFTIILEPILASIR